MVQKKKSKSTPRPIRNVKQKTEAPPVIVGIGASAGGLGAISTFLEHVPPDSGLAFVVILHLDPAQESRAAQVLIPHTRMPVVQVEDRMPVLPNRVHVILPGWSLTVSQGVLHLGELPPDRTARRPVDFFFESLADDQKEKAIGVVLSGTGSNGSAGLLAIKAAGGMTIAQDPATAEFSGMPRSAIGAGAVDHVLAPEAMPAAVLQYARHPYVTAALAPDTLEEQERRRLSEIEAILHIRTGHDFRGYRRATLVRRIHRRMGLGHVFKLGNYVALLRENPDEVDRLLRDLLINVTRLFRDPPAWDALREQVLAPLIKKRDSQLSIRAWVPGCATGEEAYSLAMLLVEEAEATEKRIDIKIFATDALADVLAVARTGIYPASVVNDLPPERVKRFFSRTEDTYQVRPDLRERLVFAPHNLLQDPPFSRMDLVTCRNVLIYLQPEAQQRVAGVFHFALRPGGHLFLGAAETLAMDGLFEPVSKKSRIYRRLDSTRSDFTDFPLVAGRLKHRTEEPDSVPSGRSSKAGETTRKALLDRFAPAAVLIASDKRVLYYYGRTELYLDQPGGEPAVSLLALARDGLRNKLKGALERALKSQDPVTLTDVPIRRAQEMVRIVVEITPLKAGTGRQQQMLVSFRDAPLASATKRSADKSTPTAERDLKDALRSARGEIKSVVEELEASNEELRASNEEVVSMNEELQSSNEELETSKEELQSLNEELSTVNAQLQGKVIELESATNDLANLLAHTDFPILFLDAKLRVRSYTPALTRLLDLLPTDTGRSIEHFAQKFKGIDMVSDAREVLEKLAPIENEVETPAGRWYVRRTVPYRTHDNRIDGIVVTFVDITARKNAERVLRSEKEYAELMVASVQESLVILDRHFQVRSANAAFYRTFGTTPEQTLGKSIFEVDGGRWESSALRIRVESLASQHVTSETFELDLHRPTGRRTLSVDGRSVGADQSVLLVMSDITDRKRITSDLQAANEGLERRTAMLGVLQDIAESANQARTADQALSFALKRIAEEQGWSVGHAFVERSPGSELVPSEMWYVREGLEIRRFQAARMRRRYRPGEGLIGKVLERGEPIWIDDIRSEPRWHAKEDFQEFAMRSAILIPIKSPGIPSAVLEFYADTPIRPEPTFLQVLRNVAVQLGRPLERYELERRILEVPDKEQREIGQELHDRLGQAVSALSMVARSVQRKLEERSIPEAADVAALVSDIEDAKRQIRLLSRGLIPEDVGPEGLPAALGNLAVRFATLSGIDCRFEGEQTVAVKDELAAAQLFRIAQEALRNAAEHALATRVAVTLRQEDGTVVLEVQDNGKGLPADRAASPGVGLRIMKYRANLIGADFELRSDGSQGTSVRCTLPVRGYAGEVESR